MTRNKLVAVVLGGFMLLGLAACDNPTDRKQTAQTEEMVAEAHRQVGMPAITNFTERKFAKMILELRDQEIKTYTYIIDMHGNLHFLTESIGYGLPYSVQFTNPERYHINGTTLPQPDPNGLFMPGGLSATWILASTPDGVKPIYVEPQILVSPFPLHDVNGDVEKMRAK